MKNFNTFITEIKSNIRSFDYLAIKKDSKGKPVMYVTDFKVVKDDGEKLECKIKGYRYMDIDDDGKVKKGWIEVDDFDSSRSHKLEKTDFKTGTVRIKIYEIKI